ncbi:two-component system response regulator EvgA [Pseudomonas sp. BIGb0408]|uniref:Two-component system response regulator EvgA n=1 Tax=Phytopseudomonas flavescens TaxID=29435 RepID=A0A7Y9XKT5_9GAMM|nr:MULTISPECIES: response regulator transcription factor [Pseudomonas]MCW2293662.1 two-component system response regulator EvgA [Pseudomonas sp. BIGb0408]NYH71769.1 two-component system response regulator EvgA [Pseudomonas flavescens]
MKTVLIVDDHPVIRLAVRLLLERDGFQIVGETDNGVDALQLAREFAPDLVVLDIGIPRLDGLEVIARLDSLGLPLRVLVLSAQPSNLFALRCLQAGAAGFVCKQEDLGELLGAAKAVLAGYSYFPKDALTTVRHRDALANDQERIDSLSDREMMVLQQLASGLSNKQIGDSMLLSNKTISTYKTRLMQKLNATSLVELIEFAKRNRLT